MNNVVSENVLISSPKTVSVSRYNGSN